jgi:2'-hydroxyisoflavone reductase
MPVWIPPANPMGGMGRIDVSKAIGKGLTFRPHVETAKATLDWWKTLPEDRRTNNRFGMKPDREKAVLVAFHEREAAEKKG